MIGVEEVERECCLRSLEGRGVPAHAQKLAIFFDPLCSLCARAKLDTNVVNSVDIDDEDVLGFRGRGRARSVLMTKIEAVPQVFEGCPFKETSVPDLNKHEKGSSEGGWLYLEAVQRSVCVLMSGARGAVQCGDSAVDTPVCPWVFSTASTSGDKYMFLEAVATDEFVQYYRYEGEPCPHLRLPNGISTRGRRKS